MAIVYCDHYNKKDSPSSGLYRVKVYTEAGMPSKIGMGIFPREVRKRFPLLPLEEESRLHDMHLRENFIDRVFAYYRLTNLLEENPTPGGLVQFHTAHKLTLMAHSPSHYQQMGRLVAQAGVLPWAELTETYGQSLMAGLGVMTSPGKHTNVLQHLMGFLKDKLSREDKAELLDYIEDYRNGLVPLIVPLTLLKHHLAITRSPTGCISKCISILIPRSCCYVITYKFDHHRCRDQSWACARVLGRLRCACGT